jgi:tetratricopeptide (TPR) repeat protein
MKKVVLLFSIILVFAFNQKSIAQVNSSQEAIAKSDTLKAHLKKAQMLTQQGNTAEASKIYTGIMEIEPDNKEAVQGWLMANMKRSPTGEEEAIKQLEELAESYPKNTAILFFKAYLESEHGHNEEALKDIEKLISSNPNDALNYIMKGQVLFGMEKYNDASQAFYKATSLDPSRGDVWAMQAGALAKIGKFDDAIVAANKGMELAPNNPVSIYNRACIYSLKGDKANALADLQKAISMNPSFKENATKDEDFKSLYNDEDFKKLTSTTTK